MNTEWIGVAEVAAELNLTDRAAWELVRRLGVPILEATRATMKNARFRRSDWESHRDASLAAPRARANSPASRETAAARAVRKAPAGIAERLAKLRGA